MVFSGYVIILMCYEGLGGVLEMVAVGGRLLGKAVSKISDEVLRVNRSIVVWDLGKWRRWVVGFSGIVIGIVCGEFKVLGGGFGCLETLGSGKAALVKKRSPVSEGRWSKGVVNEGGFQSNFLRPVGRVLWLGLRSFRVVGSLGGTCEKSLSCPIVARLGMYL